MPSMFVSCPSCLFQIGHTCLPPPEPCWLVVWSPLLKVKDGSKPAEIAKGKGTALEDIPNVAEKLGRLTRSSPLVGLLHNLVFGGKAKVGTSLFGRIGGSRFACLAWKFHDNLVVSPVLGDELFVTRKLRRKQL